MDKKTLWDLEYADDTALLAISLSTLVEMMKAFGEESEKLGLYISVPKTKWMVINGQEESGSLTYKNSEIERVDRFIYLGSELVSGGACDKEVTRRLGLAGAVFSKLEKGLWRRRDIKLQTKLRVYNALVVPVALYGTEMGGISRAIRFLILLRFP